MTKIHLWDFAPSRASVCGYAVYTDSITADPGKATCAKCYLEHLRRMTAPVASV